MKIFAVIDIGSNSVRLMLLADGTVLYKRLQTTRLGEGLAQTGRLKTEAISRTAAAVADFYKQAKAEGAIEVVAFATAAVRAAVNGQAFVDTVYELCSLKVDVISGEKEAEIGILGALGQADGAVVDIGGASTELVVKRQGKLVYKKSIPIGVVRLKDECGREETALKTRIQTALKEFDDAPALQSVCAIGGTATTLAAQGLGLQEYSSKAVTGFCMPYEKLLALHKKLSALTVAEMEKLPCMPKGRADVLTGGSMLLCMLMQKLDVRELAVSDRDNLEGYAIQKGWLL